MSSLNGSWGSLRKLGHLVSGRSMKLRRVFALVPDCHVPGWRYASVWERHFYRGLEQAGLTVIRPRDVDFGWARPVQSHDQNLAAGDRMRASETLLAQILTGDNAPQAVLSCCFSHDLETELVDRVRGAGIPWVNFFCDSLYAFDRVSVLAARTSLNWFVESEAEPRYRALGVPCLCAPYALNPDALPDASAVASRHPLLFVGSATRQRLRAAALIRLAGADLHVRGWGWPEALAPRSSTAENHQSLTRRAARGLGRCLLGSRVGGHLDDAALLGHLRDATVVLGLNEYPGGGNAGYLKLRDVEFPGMGCCYLTQHHADLESAFDVGQEILSFHTPWEAARLAAELARHPAACREFGRRARARVLRDHTWSARLSAIEARL